MDEPLVEMLRQNLLALLEETLHSHQGVYTNPGTSLLETLETIDAAQASKTFAHLPETIAGHAGHAKYYLENTLALLKGGPDEGFDVAKSWERKQVTPDEWAALRGEFAATYAQVMGYVARAEDWGDNRLAGVVAMIAHTAYHLGAIRQLKEL